MSTKSVHKEPVGGSDTEKPQRRQGGAFAHRAKPQGEPQNAGRGPCCCGTLEGAADGMNETIHARHGPPGTGVTAQRFMDSVAESSTRAKRENGERFNDA
ncbi:hypothetical protein SH501x_001751 [Pirellulaceae bacterium SH501]